MLLKNRQMDIQADHEIQMKMQDINHSKEDGYFKCILLHFREYMYCVLFII